MVTPKRAQPLRHRSAAEFGRPNDQGVLQHPPLFEVLEQPGDRTVHDGCLVVVVADDVLVADEDAGVVVLLDYQAKARVTKTFAPVYPAELWRAGVTGTARLLAVITPQGSVAQLQPLEGLPALIDSGTTAASQ